MHNQTEADIFIAKIKDLGRKAHSDLGAKDLRLFKRLKLSSITTQILGRLILNFISGPWAWITGMGMVAYSLSVEAQMNHSVMHGAFEKIDGADRFVPEKYETLAIPFQSKTWGDAHRIHHSNPSLMDLDPDTIHPLIRVHKDTPWRPWHIFNTFLGAIFVFECWAFDYDGFLKNSGNREKSDRGEIRKFLLYISYQYILFPVLAGHRWAPVLAANIGAAIIRNLVFIALQTGSSVGSKVSTLHHRNYGKKTPMEWYRFQIESSKNYILGKYWKNIFGGLDRHIEHHLFPNLPPNRLHAISPELRELCKQNSINYEEHSSLMTSFGDSLSYLWKLSFK
jgi:NADPH-dependent stearoyl-CoA 9-desaturase